LLLTDYKFFLAKSLRADATDSQSITVRRLGLQDYVPIWRAMQYIADHAEKGRGDEIWLLTHKPVFTLGQAGKSEHVLTPGNIPLIQTDRGGQVTYHGPGQLVLYLLLKVKDRQLGVRKLVDLIEHSIIATLSDYGLSAEGREGAPGVYVDDAKIAALGLRIRNGRSFHGLSLNVDMDLEPFSRIDPCGYKGLAVTQIADLVPESENLMQKVSIDLTNHLLTSLNHEHITANEQ
jgi:lipoyl(octanoyl) transferase